MALATWVALAWSILNPGLQEGWRDTHRVHLRNGQFLDGRLEEIGEKDVLFRWSPSALMRIRLMEIKRIEEIKIRPLRSAPKAVPLPETTVRTPDIGEKTDPTDKTSGAPPEMAAAIEEITASLMTASEARRAALVKRLRSLGVEGARHLISQLPKYDPPRASAALLALGQLKDLDLDGEIRALLRSDKPILRQESCLILAARESTASVPALVALIRDPVAGVRGAAVEALGRLGDQARLGLLAEAAKDPDPGVRAMALHFGRALAGRTDSEIELARLWLDILTRGSVDVNVGLAPAIGRLAGTPKNPEVPSAELVGALVERLSDRSPQVRAAAARGIGEARTAGAAVSADLLTALEGELADEASAALCEALGNVVARGAVDALIGKLETGSEVVKDAAHRALRKITSQPFDLDPEKWRVWRATSQ